MTVIIIIFNKLLKNYLLILLLLPGDAISPGMPSNPRWPLIPGIPGTPGDPGGPFNPKKLQNN